MGLVRDLDRNLSFLVTAALAVAVFVLVSLLWSVEALGQPQCPNGRCQAPPFAPKFSAAPAAPQPMMPTPRPDGDGWNWEYVRGYGWCWARVISPAPKSLPVPLKARLLD